MAENQIVIPGKPGQRLCEVMADLRAWLNAQQIADAVFAYSEPPIGGYQVTITFATADHASRFGAAFCWSNG